MQGTTVTVTYLSHINKIITNSICIYIYILSLVPGSYIRVHNKTSKWPQNRNYPEWTWWRLKIRLTPVASRRWECSGNNSIKVQNTCQNFDSWCQKDSDSVLRYYTWSNLPQRQKAHIYLISMSVSTTTHKINWFKLFWGDLFLLRMFN